MSVTLEDIKEVYYLFRKTQGEFFGRGFRMPKDFEKHYNEKMAEVNKKALMKITRFFYTKWSNIDPKTYFKFGFRLFGKNFSYIKFFDKRIINRYIEKDKNKKRIINISKKDFLKSAIFVKKYMRKKNLDKLNDYMLYKVNDERLPFNHYFNNKINAMFFVWLITKGFKLTEEEKNKCPYIKSNYQKIILMLEKMKKFLNEVEVKINK